MMTVVGTKSMQKNKDRILEAIVQLTKKYESLDDQAIKFDTAFLSHETDIQRTNMSTILNQLVEEGKIIKTNGRPVLYSLAKDVKEQVDDEGFMSMVGYDNSLKQVIQYTKAAISYPLSIPRILYIAQKGTGITHLSKSVYQYAQSKGILKNNAPYKVLDASHYESDQLIHLFDTSLLKECNHGLLLVKNADKVPNNLFDALLNQRKEKVELVLLVQVSDSEKGASLSDYFNFTVEVAPLKERGLSERFGLIELFFKKEAQRLNRRIEVNQGLMQCLMLFPCPNNCVDLEKNIQFGVANALVKPGQKQKVRLDLSDFAPIVRKGLLYYEANQHELKEVLQPDYTYIFDSQQTYHIRQDIESNTIYQRLEKKRKLLGSSINNQDLDSFVEEELNEYLEQLVINYDDTKLEKQVSQKLRDMVKDFLNEAEKKFNKLYSNKIYYGICLHLDNAFITKFKQRISHEKVLHIMEQHEEEYLFSRRFIKEVEKAFNVTFSLDETAFITLFLSLDFELSQQAAQVVTLVAMHGDHTASSMADVARELMPTGIIESFDIPLHEDIDTTYDRLKEKIIHCNQGKGVLVLYDMGSIQIMLNAIMEETRIEIRYFEIPITLFVMAGCKYSHEGKSINEIYSLIQDEYMDSTLMRKLAKEIIIVLSSLEEKNSDMIKNHLMTLEDYNSYRFIAFNTSDQSHLMNQVNQIQSTGKIIGVIGTYNPNIFNLPYVNYQEVSHVRSIRELFADVQEGLDILDYLTQQFEIFTHADLEVTFLPLLNQLESIFSLHLKNDAKIGFLIHMGCLVDRLVKKQGAVANLKESEIQSQYPELVEQVQQALKPVGKYYHISFSSGDATTIVDIFKNAEKEDQHE